MIGRVFGEQVITAGSGWNPNRDADQPSSSPSPADQTTAQKLHILIVEDNKADVFLIREAIETARVAATLHVLSDGDKAIMFFETADRDETAPCPSLVILDINLPRRNGQEVVYQMRQSRRCAAAPVVVVTSSDSERDRDEMKKLGVEHYFRKPSEYGEFMKLGDLVREVLRESGGGD